jgi:hypothetical protein
MTAIATVVNDNTDYYYYNNPFALPFHDIDGQEFEKVGRACVKAFGIKSAFLPHRVLRPQGRQTGFRQERRIRRPRVQYAPRRRFHSGFDRLRQLDELL